MSVMREPPSDRPSVVGSAGCALQAPARGGDDQAVVRGKHGPHVGAVRRRGPCHAGEELTETGIEITRGLGRAHGEFHIIPYVRGGRRVYRQPDRTALRRAGTTDRLADRRTTTTTCRTPTSRGSRASPRRGSARTRAGSLPPGPPRPSGPPHCTGGACRDRSAPAVLARSARRTAGRRTRLRSSDCPTGTAVGGSTRGRRSRGAIR